jgi:hypothetical protein
MGDQYTESGTGYGGRCLRMPGSITERPYPESCVATTRFSIIG